MKKFLFLFLVICSIYMPIANAMGKKEEPKEKIHLSMEYVPRGLLIFLDKTEKGVGAMTFQALQAISQKASPIIISQSLLANIFSNYKDINTYKQKSVFELKNSFGFPIPNPITQEDIAFNNKSLAIALIAASFKPEEWVIKKIGESVYLLVYHDYLKILNEKEKLNIDIKSVAKYDSSSNPKIISQFELKLGLKLNHMEDAEFQEIIDTPSSSIGGISNYDSLLMEKLYNKYTNISEIFCIRSDYANQKIIKQPIWSILISGHGKMKESIAYLSLDHFKDFLDFLEHKIYTKLLVYISCYSAGLNTQEIYKNSKVPLQKTYPFAIATVALTDAPVKLYSLLSVEIGPNNNLVLKKTTNFVEFLEEITKQDVIDYQKAMKNIPVEGDVSKPQIKLPGTEWFSVMTSKKKVVPEQEIKKEKISYKTKISDKTNIASIGSILAKSRDPEKTLDIVTFFNTDPEGPNALLLYASDIPFPLIINVNRKMSIISMVPGDAVHKIEEIKSKNSADEIIKMFMTIDFLDSHKIFYIKKINNLDDVIVEYKKISGRSGFTTTPDQYSCVAFFTKNKSPFIKTGRYNGHESCSQEQNKQYQALLAKINGELIPLGSYVFGGYERIFSAFNDIDFTNSTIFTRLEGKNDADIFSILSILYSNAKSTGSIVWIKELKAPYMSSEQEFRSNQTFSSDPTFKIHGIKNGEIITLNDVIIDGAKTSAQAYFTYNGKYYFASKEINHDYRDEYKKVRLLKLGQLEGSLLPSQATPEEIKKLKELLQKKLVEKKAKEKTEEFKPIEQTKKVTEKKEEIKPVGKIKITTLYTRPKKPVEKKVEIEKKEESKMVEPTSKTSTIVPEKKIELVKESASVKKDKAKENLEKPKDLFIFTEKNYFGQSNPVIEAIKKNRLDILEYLVKDGGKRVLAKYAYEAYGYDNKLGKSTLHWAAEYSNIPIVKFLKENGAISSNEIDSDKEGKTTLHYAVLNPDPAPIIQFFIDHGADIRALDSVGLTRLNVQAIDKLGRTPLHYAVLEDKLVAAEYLIDVAKADKYQFDYKGKRPIDLAISWQMKNLFSDYRQIHDLLSKKAREKY